MNIVFFGTPCFGQTVLRGLGRSSHRVVLVVTAPDKPRGRGLKVAPPPVKVEAERLGIPVIQPVNLRDPDVVGKLEAAAADLMVCAAYGKIVPKRILEIFPLGCVNVHPSMLPKYRGAAPIQRAIMAGEKTTGVTTMFMSAGCDEGDIILQEEVSIEEEDTAGTLEDKLSRVGLPLLMKTLDLIASGEAPRRRQDSEEATYAPPISRDEEWIDWSSSSRSVANLVRALDPSPGARTALEGKTLKIWRARGVDSGELKGIGPLPSSPGEAIPMPRGEGILVRAGEGYVLIAEVQPEGKRRMSAREFLAGNPLPRGARFSGPKSVPRDPPCASGGA